MATILHAIHEMKLKTVSNLRIINVCYLLNTIKLCFMNVYLKCESL